MSITYSFKDDTEYGTDDINNITANLTGAGVAPFMSKSEYSTSDFNALTAAVVGQGTSLGGCKCTYSGGSVTVAQGIVYFENGMTAAVDSDGYSFDIEQNTAGTVYAYHSPTLQTVEIKFSAALPETGYSVKLAEIAADGTVRDCRNFARSKAATFGSNAKITKEFTYSDPELSDGKYIYGKITDAPLSGFSYAIVRKAVISDGRANYAVNSVFDLNKNEFLFATEGGETSASIWYCGNLLSGSSGSNNKTYIEKSDNELRLYCLHSYDSGERGFSVTFV